MAVREVTNKILDLASAGMISYCDLALVALKWMSEEEVAAMCRANGLFIDEE